jgi:hypothetical protein
MKIKVISSLINLQNSKEEIVSNINQNNFYQSYDFIECLMKIYPKKKFKIILSTNENKYIFLPLYSFNYYMREFYGFVGSPHFNEENSLCHTYKDQADLVSDLEYIFSETKLDKLSLYLNNLDHETNSIFKVIKLIEVSCFKTNSINLKNDILWNSANTKNKVIKNLDFKLRKFFNQKNSTQDDIKLDSNNINLDDVKNFILKNKNVNLKNKKILNENVKIFFSLYEKITNVEISQLKYKNTLLSIVLGITNKNKYYYFMPCFNNLFHKYSFGNNHLIRLILNKKKLGVGSFVLGAGEEKYKKNFNVDDEKIYLLTNDKYLKFFFKLKNFLVNDKIHI